ncbi:FAD-dependent oxidoreductase [Burkholderia ubonensis]|uniref:Pyridine nucleotide-disulfide oxidoreductase n=1 Tax=Burkholderia ubonensis TaxID=101571 RepID=A0A107EW09_9BURK|nr:FAD-dependent oxidoreductase [Burkholderia ubonensis]KWD77546.1 pyridine nucleotide-disulfide oxidoreductase [Burkholderia ubonensis]KWD82412.1 pyridine nucleotide-disulfide oxidoreductase [Burkholderia ubonensis]KWD95453.1 pyridine nucleotide-disulfide oxidoreductase [Burkholderia ubonensis]KWD95839.1 pyridine nucleotide-disulfide oxidoreductase [Burkholderia ubonensis]
MREVDYLAIGGGVACATAVQTLRREDDVATIAMLCGEPVPPYRRPPLTKLPDVGDGATGIILHDAVFYEQQRIALLLGARATHVDRHARIVRTDTQGEFHYGKLLIATGTSPRLPSLPGLELGGVHCLHTLADMLALRREAGRAQRVVILGAGFIGVEVAATLQARGVHVTLIEREPDVMPMLQAPVLSRFFAACCATRGIAVRTGCELRALIGDGRVEAALTSDGATLPCDLALIAIGVTPNCDFLADSGLPIGDGIEVDAFLRSADPHIYAAGDVANFPDPVFGVRRRIEHWDNAMRQGRIAAHNMAGRPVPYRDVSIFFGDVFGLTYNFLGDLRGATETIERGTLGDGPYALLYLKDDALRAAFAVAQPPESIASLADAISMRLDLKAERGRLQDVRFPLDRLPVQTLLILQGGGALGAFECGVARALDEHGIRPDVVSAVSIGAFNGAIIASHPKSPSRALDAFWRELAIPLPSTGDPRWQQMLVSAYVFWFGVPNFLAPRWWNPLSGLDWLYGRGTSLYDARPIVKLIEKYVDFAALGSSPTRLLISAVDVKSGEPRIFDSYVDRLTPEHLLASGSLPPGIPWTKLDGHAYWDGGIVSNSPLDLIVERCGRIGGRIFIVDLFSGSKRMPENLVEVMLRREEISYMDRVRSDLRFEEYANDFSDLVGTIMAHVDEPAASTIRQLPLYIRLMGNREPIRVERIALQRTGPVSFVTDYDFSATTIAELQARGHAAAIKALADRDAA